MKIFISYNKKNKAIFTSLCGALRAANLDYWDSNLRAGESLKDQLKEGISECGICIFIATRSSVKSKWCLNEIAAFWGAHKRVILLKADHDIKPPLLFKEVYWIEDVEEAIRQIKGEVSKVRNMKQTVSKSNQQAPKNKKQSGLNRGIVSKGELETSNKRIPGEVFAIELLTEEIFFKRDSNQTIVTIDRRNTDECIVTNAGKTEAVLKYAAGNEKVLRRKDEEIQNFLNGTSNIPPKLDLRELNLRLRWASGGVLSIVTFNNKDYVPFFFRDICPYGWNISLGSSERSFKNGKLDTEFKVENEWDDPMGYIKREFMEESLVINNSPALEDSPVFKKLKVQPMRFIGRGVNPPSDSGERIRRFVEEQAAQREEEDNFTIRWDAPLSLKATPGEGNAAVEIFSSSKNRLLPQTEKILIAFSLLDLGIEIVQVYKYSLEPNDYMLDGEILRQKDDEKELVRMPIALFSCQYLAKTFGKNQEWYRYTLGPEPSIEVERPPAAKEVHLFSWDVKRRIEILKNPKQSTGWQIRRFHDWYYKFGREHFVDRKGEPSAESLPSLFVPGTAKILNQYFSISEVYDKYKGNNPS